MSPRRPLLEILALAKLLIAGAAAAAPSPIDTTTLSADDRAFVRMVDRPVVLTAPGMDRVRVLENLAYRPDGPSALRADVYLPPRAGPAAPIVVLVHGGMGPEFPYRPKDWGLYRSWGRLLAASGMVAVVFNHRAGFPQLMLDEANDDVHAVLRFARERARAWGGDPERIAVVAYSGGGPLLAPLVRESPAYLRCLVSMYGILDGRESQLHRGQLSASQLEAFSATVQMAQAADRMPPLLVVRAGRDAIPDLLRGVDRFLRESLERNAPVLTVNHPEAAHGFDNDARTPRTLAVLRLMVAFLKEHLQRR